MTEFSPFGSTAPLGQGVWEGAGLDIKKFTFNIFLTTSLARGASISVSSLNGKIQTCVSNCMFVHEVANIYADELKLIRAKTNKVYISS